VQIPRIRRDSKDGSDENLRLFIRARGLDRYVDARERRNVRGVYKRQDNFHSRGDACLTRGYSWRRSHARLRQGVIYKGL